MLDYDTKRFSKCCLISFFFYKIFIKVQTAYSMHITLLSRIGRDKSDNIFDFLLYIFMEEYDCLNWLLEFYSLRTISIFYILDDGWRGSRKCMWFPENLLFYGVAWSSFYFDGVSEFCLLFCWGMIVSAIWLLGLIIYSLCLQIWEWLSLSLFIKKEYSYYNQSAK
jgi:hypothetical protein